IIERQCNFFPRTIGCLEHEYSPNLVQLQRIVLGVSETVAIERIVVAMIVGASDADFAEIENCGTSGVDVQGGQVPSKCAKGPAHGLEPRGPLYVFGTVTKHVIYSLRACVGTCQNHYES